MDNFNGKGNITSGLMVLVLHSNKFNGSIPLEFCHLDSLQLYLVPKKHKRKKKNIKENDFLIFGCLIKYFKENYI